VNNITTFRSDGLACVYPDELKLGFRIMHVSNISRSSPESALSFGVDISDPEKYHEDNCVLIISHETVHSVLFDLTDVYTTTCYDNVDTWGRLHKEIFFNTKK